MAEHTFSHLMEDITQAFAPPDVIVNNVSSQDAGFAYNNGTSDGKNISEQEVASVRLLTLELSEDEIIVLVAALTTLLQECDDRAIDAKAGASRDEVEAILQDLHTFLQQSSHQSMRG